jgi:DNA-binding MarR family transcriptional regulator
MGRGISMNGMNRDRAAERMLELLPVYMGTITKSGNLFGSVQAARYRVLALLCREGSLPMSEVARRQYISKSYMTALVDGLEQEGFVERRPHPKDRRVIAIVITERGRNHMRESLARFRGDMRNLLSPLGDEEIETLCRSADDLIAVLRKVP